MMSKEGILAWVEAARSELGRLEVALVAAPDSSDEAVQLALEGMVEVCGDCPLPQNMMVVTTWAGKVGEEASAEEGE